MAFPSGVIDNVTVIPSPPDNGLPLNETSRTNVLLDTFRIVSFKSSIACVRIVSEVNPLKAPSVKEPSVTVPSVSELASDVARALT